MYIYLPLRANTSELFGTRDGKDERNGSGGNGLGVQSDEAEMAKRKFRSSSIKVPVAPAGTPSGGPRRGAPSSREVES